MTHMACTGRYRESAVSELSMDTHEESASAGGGSTYHYLKQRFEIALGITMHFHFRCCNVDATPEFTMGRYLARARIEFLLDLPATNGNAIYESDDLGDFDSMISAIDFARKWAIDWINARLTPVTYH
jgi:hypothetical protein